MLPLDVISFNGAISNPSQLTAQLKALKSAGVDGYAEESSREASSRRRHSDAALRCASSLTDLTDKHCSYVLVCTFSVMTDVWWGLVEQTAQQYNWSGCASPHVPSCATQHSARFQSRSAPSLTILLFLL
jgi:hypothetical protein